MFWLLIIGLIFGGIAASISHNYEQMSSHRAIGWAGFAIGMIAVFLVGSVSSAVGERWAKDNQLTYNEFLNGYETEAIHTGQPCHRDGSCHYEYNCDPYTVPHTTTDSKGNTSTYYTTEYHSCPYATEEWTFVIKTSLKRDYTISVGFTDQPQEWRGGSGIPEGVQRGIPAFWAAAKQRVESGNPGPVTVTSTYKNYILASQNTILKQFSGAVEDYKKQNLLPKLSTAQDNSGIVSPYLGTKTYFVKHLSNEAAWTAAVNQFDSALGTNLQGDMHVVFVDKDVDKDQYKGALNAYWTGPELDKNGLSKNGIVLIIGTDGQTSSWVRAFTGMPGGNEAMLADLESMKSLDLSKPEEVLGTPRGIINEEKKVKEIAHTKGQVESIVWGVNKFQRVCMVCADADDKGTGFSYLDGQIEPTGGQTAVIILVSSLLFALIWALIAWAQIPSPNITIPNRKEN